MKNFSANYFFLTLFLLGTVAACDRAETPLPEVPKTFLWGSVKAIINDTLIWEGTCSTFIPVPTIDSLYGFSFIKQNNFGIRMHEVYFGHIPLRVQKILLSEGCINPPLGGVPRSFLSTHLDYDLIDAYYCLNTSDTIDDFIEITEIDFLTKEVKGSVQGSYYISPPFMDRSDMFFPDTVVFVKCDFHAKYEL